MASAILSHLPPWFSHTSATAAIPTILLNLSGCLTFLHGPWPDVVPKRPEMRWGSLASLPTTTCSHHVSIYVPFLLSLLSSPANPPSLSSGSHSSTALPSLLPKPFYCYLSSHTNLFSYFPSLTNIYPGSSYCHLSQPTAKRLEKSYLHSLSYSLSPNYSPTRQTQPRIYLMRAGFATSL